MTDAARLMQEHEAHYGARPDPNWPNPRAVIAPDLKDNDLAYSIAGAWHAAAIIRGLDLRPSDLAKLTLMDVGCGTGKLTRILHMFVQRADGYDPVPQCVDAAREETARCTIRADRWPPRFYYAPPNRTYDILVCADVLPGLGLARTRELCDTFARLSVPGTMLAANVLAFRQPTISKILARRAFDFTRCLTAPANLAALGLYLWERHA